MTVPNVFVSGTLARAEEVNENNDYLETLLSGGGVLTVNYLPATGEIAFGTIAGSPNWSDIPGCSFTTTDAGDYIIFGFADIEIQTALTSDFVNMALRVNNTARGTQVSTNSNGAFRAPYGGFWVETGVASGTTFKLSCTRANAINSRVYQTGSKMLVVRYA